MRRLLAAAAAMGMATVLTVVADTAPLAVVPTAAAHPLTSASRTLAAGQAAVTPCGDLSAVVADFTITGGTVTAVLLSGFPASCNGGLVSVTVTSGATPIASGGPVTVTNGSATVAVSPAAATSALTHVHFVVSGP